MASDLTAPQILDIRRNYLRDEWNDAAPNPGGISHYNTAKGRNFFTNDQIKAMDEEVARRWTADLEQNESDSIADDMSEADAAAQRRSSRYHLIAALGLSQIADDPGYTAAQTVKGSDALGNRRAIKRQSLSHWMAAGVSYELVR